jgi:hypothetical protein
MLYIFNILYLIIVCVEKKIMVFQEIIEEGNYDA